MAPAKVFADEVQLMLLWDSYSVLDVHQQYIIFVDIDKFVEDVDCKLFSNRQHWIFLPSFKWSMDWLRTLQGVRP